MFIRTKRAQLMLSLLCLALGAGASAQDNKPQEKPKQEPKQEKPVAQPAAAPAAMIGIPLTGVTKDNSAKVSEALQKISHTGYHCPKCEATSTTEGTCKMCSVPLEKDATPKQVVKSSTIDDKGMLKVALEPGQRLRFSEIDQAAKSAGGSVNRAEYTVPAYARLIVAGPANAEQAKKLEKALTDAKVFTAVTVGVDENTKELYVMPTSGSVKLASAISGIEKAGAEFKYQDLVIAAPCVACAKSGKTEAACKACWEPSMHT